MPAYDNQNAPPAFDDYAAALRKLRGAAVQPLLYAGEDGSDTSPYMGTFGHLMPHAAINAPLVAPSEDYGGDLPVQQQPRVNVPDPWNTGGA